MYPKMIASDPPLCTNHAEIQDFVQSFIATIKPGMFGYASPTMNYVIHVGLNEIAIQDPDRRALTHMDIALNAWEDVEQHNLLGGTFQLQYKKEYNTQIFKIILIDPHETFLDVHSRTIEILRPLRNRMPFPKNSKVIIVRG